MKIEFDLIFNICQLIKIVPRLAVATRCATYCLHCIRWRSGVVEKNTRDVIG
jgi:hypothetical protein